MNKALSSLITDQVLNTITKEIGSKTPIPKQYVTLASTLLFGALSKNMASNDGKSNILGLLGQFGGGNKQAGLLGNLVQLVPNILGSNKSEGLVSGILGNQLNPIVEAFSKATGMDKAKSKQLLIVVGGLIVTYLLTRKKENNMSDDELADDIHETYKNPGHSTETQDDGGLLGKLLGKDDDGMVDEVAGLFKKLIQK